MSASANILIVDDVADNRAILARPLRRRGFSIVEAEDGQSALELIATQDFDLALLDISMPDIDGLDVLRHLSASQRSALPVIMVTARTHTDDALAAFSLGARDYVTKPIDLPVLIARVETQLAQKRSEQRLRHSLEKAASLNFQLQSECNRRAESEALAQDCARHDPLTGLYNRLHFRNVLSAALTNRDDAESVALLCLDLDGFKQVNDKNGHAAGDELLQAVAHRLRGCISDTETISRLGGDEFAILMPRLESPNDAQALASRAVYVMGIPFVLESGEVSIGCSVGLALADGRSADADLLYRDADSALYLAKAQGRGTWRLAGRPSAF